LLPAGVVLVGGGAHLHGSVDLAKEYLKLPAQTGFPVELAGLVDKVDSPAFSVSVGMVLWALENDLESVDKKQSVSKGPKSKEFILSSPSVKNTVGSIKKWFGKFLP
jgi:cell division ATPase FtsA